MDIIETNDDMEISSDHGYLHPPGEGLDTDVASMRDPSLEPDPDFMIEDLASDGHKGDEGMGTITQEQNDDEMIDEDVQDQALVTIAETIDYDHDIQDDFDATLDTLTDQHYDLDTEPVAQIDIHDTIPDVDVEPLNAPNTLIDPARPNEAGDVPHTTTTNQDEADAQDQDALDDSTSIHPLPNKENTDTPNSHPNSPQPNVQVSEAFADDTTAIAAEPGQGDEAPQPNEDKSTSREEPSTGIYQTSNEDQLRDETSHVGAEDPLDDEHSPTEGFESEIPELTVAFHPVKVFHEGSEVFLFPPVEEDSSETFFLHDESLNHQSLSALLKACREVLGSSINDEEELEIEFHDLGLRTSEDSLHASQITMSQIIDVYLRLRQNEGDSDPQPLFVSLRTRPHFSSRFFIVAKAAEEGKGSSYLSLWQEQFNIDPQDPLSNLADDKSDREHSGQLEEADYTEARSAKKAPDNNLTEAHNTDPNHENAFHVADDDTGLRDHDGYGDFDESNREPTGIEASESHNSEFGEQDAGEQSIHDEAENAFGADEDVNHDRSAGTSTLQGDDFTHNNGCNKVNPADFTTENDENLAPEGDFFDEAVRGYDDAHDGHYDLGLDDYGDHAQGDDANEDPNPILHNVDHGNQNIAGDDLADSSFAFINADEFDNPQEISGSEEEGHFQDSYRQTEEQGDGTFTDERNEFEDVAEDTPPNPADAEHKVDSSTAIASNPTQPRSTPPSETRLQHHSEASSDRPTTTTDIDSALDIKEPPANGTKVNGSSIHTPPEPIFDDSDEINYDDEDDTAVCAVRQTTPKGKTRQALASPKSVKRNRPDEDEEDLIEYATPDPKRRRS